MYVGNKNRIDVTSSQFKEFIEEGNLYVDKTAFIEHILQDRSKVLLFTRPRRMGKSLNMNTLGTFLDCKQNTSHLFSGLYIERSDEFKKVNKYPVIYLSFKDYRIDSYKKLFRRDITKTMEKYLTPEQYGRVLTRYINDETDYDPSILRELMQVLSEVYGENPYILIDEYDKPIMDNIHRAELPELKEYITTLFSSALKDNPYLGKAVMTGVTRIAKENMFSGLNNLEVYDVLTEGAYDADFSLTEAELTELVPEPQIDGARRWYNNMRVGKELLYNIFSVMNYLKKPNAGLKGYWAMSGSESLLGELLNASRVETINRMLLDERYRYKTSLNDHITIEHLKDVALCTDISFYTLAVQAGYLSFEPTDYEVYRIYIPNMEARKVWARLILDTQYKSADNKLQNIFEEIDNVDIFGKQLTDFMSMVLSYNDFKAQAEWVYHVFFLGLVHSLGYECKSNLEAGLGRFDIMMRARRFNAVIEFKSTKSASDASLKRAAGAALAQIAEKEYMRELRDSPLPAYKIGIACHGKKCLVKVEQKK